MPRYADVEDRSKEAAQASRARHQVERQVTERNGRKLRVSSRWCFLLIVLALAAPAGAEWHVQQAPIRFTLSLSGRPTPGSAGYFTHLPDGGLLPVPFPLTHVVTEKGKVIESYVLWQNRASGLGLVFKDPGPTKTVHVYVSSSRALRLWNLQTGLTPSAILCADPEADSMAAAKKLAQLGAAGPTVHYRNDEGHPRAPLSIGGDASGRSRPCAFYLLAHLITSDPGKTWVAPFVFDGECEVRIDGKPVVPQKRIDKWGGTGQWVTLSKGLHRLEVLQACGGEGGFSGGGGLMYMTWRTPKTTMRELGGVRSKKVPMPGTSRMETRMVRGNEIARSGSCSLREIKSRDDVPTPHILMSPLNVYWLEKESPIIVYELDAVARGNPVNTTYNWNFAGGATLRKQKVLWPFPGGREQNVSLTASSDGKSLRCVQPFFAHSTVRSSLNDAQTRAHFREAALNLFEAYPAETDPTGSFDSSFWNNLIRCMELGKGLDLLSHLFSTRRVLFGRKLVPAQQQLLTDIFFDALPRSNPHKALQWTEVFEKEAESNRVRADKMKIVRAEIHLYYLQDTDKARSTLLDILRRNSADPMSERARIRAGDIEFMAGDLNKATELYGDVQNRASRQRQDAAKEQSKATEQKLRPRLARSRAEINARKKPGNSSSKKPSTGDASFSIDPNIDIADWKLNAVLDVSASENIRALIEQDFLLEAKQALADWELQSPLSKVSSDYILHEATLYMKLEDWTRARALLDAYFDQVDASSFLPAAARALLDCMLNTKASKQELLEFREAVKKKLQYHPVGQEIEQIIVTL